jgi:hypothetical protein
VTTFNAYPSTAGTVSNSSQTIDLFLHRANQYIDWLYSHPCPFKPAFRPLIITSPNISTLNLPRLTGRPLLPSTPFTNPFANHSLAELRQWHKTCLSDRKEFTSFVFLVLDEYSAEYECVHVVDVGGGDDDWVSCEFGVAMEVAMVLEVMTHRIDEGQLGELRGTGRILGMREWLGYVPFEEWTGVRGEE